MTQGKCTGGIGHLHTPRRLRLCADSVSAAEEGCPRSREDSGRGLEGRHSIGREEDCVCRTKEIGRRVIYNICQCLAWNPPCYRFALVHLTTSLHVHALYTHGPVLSAPRMWEMFWTQDWPQ